MDKEKEIKEVLRDNGGIWYSEEVMDDFCKRKKIEINIRSDNLDKAETILQKILKK